MNESTASDAAATAAASATKPLGDVIAINEGLIRYHLGKIVVTTVEETLNALVDAEADQLCGAKRYEHSAEQVDTRAGHYERQLHTKAGEVTLKVPKLHSLLFESAVIERYNRGAISVEEALVEMYLAGVFCSCIAAVCGWANCSAYLCAITTRASVCCASTKPNSINHGSFRSAYRWRGSWTGSSCSGRASIGGSSRTSRLSGVAALATRAT